MLRPRKQLIVIIAGILWCCVHAAAQSEVTLTRCWQYPVDDVVALAAGEEAIFAGMAGGRIVALSPEGEKLWETDLGGQIEPRVAVAGGELLVATQSGTQASLRRLSLETGLPMNSVNKAEIIPTPEVPDAGVSTRLGDLAVSGDERGVVSARAADGTLVWSFKAGGAINALHGFKDNVIALSHDNFVYSLKLRNGALRWKRRLLGRAAWNAIWGQYLFVAVNDQQGASLVELTAGRLVGQLALNDGDTIATRPVVVGDALVLATADGIDSFSVSGCRSTQNGP